VTDRHLDPTPATPGRDALRARRERGAALIWSLFAMMMIATIIASGTTSFLALDKMASADFSAEGQARAVAEAGLVDAFAWFRRQQVQPVTTFAPRRDLAAIPPVNETDDPSIGLVREYEILPSLWGRYEVRKPVVPETYTDANANGLYDSGEAYVDANGNGKRDPGGETTDVSLQRGLPGLGGVWQLVSHGIIFRRPRTDLPLGTGPNQRVAGSVISSQIRRLTITPPGSAALCAKTASTITIGNRGRVSGRTKTGIVYKSSTGAPTLLAGSEVTGTPATGSLATYSDTVPSVFGVSLIELKGMADASYADVASFPASIGEYTLQIANSAITFDAARPLRGTGIVVVLGNCTIDVGSNSFFNGLLYVQGNLTVRAPAYLRGTIIATGTVDIRGTGGDYVEVDYDASILTQLLTLMGQYRYCMAVYEPAPLDETGTPKPGLLHGLFGLLK
jgi:hypothetical protein